MLVDLDLLKMRGKSKKIFSQMVFNGDVPWWKEKHHLKQIQVDSLKPQKGCDPTV